MISRPIPSDSRSPLSAIQHPCYPAAGEAGVHLQRHALSGESVHHAQQPDVTATGDSIRDETQSPFFVGACRGLVIEAISKRYHAGLAPDRPVFTGVTDSAGVWRQLLFPPRGYDTAGFVERMRSMGVTPHVAQNDSNRRSAVDGRTTRHEGYAISQRKRKRVEEVFGWMKTVALQRKTRFIGPERTGWMFTFAAAAYNLVQMRNLQTATP